MTCLETYLAKEDEAKRISGASRELKNANSPAARVNAANVIVGAATAAGVPIDAARTNSYVMDTLAAKYSTLVNEDATNFLRRQARHIIAQIPGEGLVDNALSLMPIASESEGPTYAAIFEKHQAAHKWGVMAEQLRRGEDIADKDRIVGEVLAEVKAGAKSYIDGKFGSAKAATREGYSDIALWAYQMQGGVSLPKIVGERAEATALAFVEAAGEGMETYARSCIKSKVRSDDARMVQLGRIEVELCSA